MLRRFLSFMQPYRWRYAAGLALLLLTTAVSLGIPRLLGGAIEAMEEEAGLRVVARFAGGMILLASAQAVFRTASRLTLLGASRHVVHDVRERFFDRLARQSSEFFDANRIGDLMSRGVNDMQLLRSFYGPGLLNLMNTVIVYVGVLSLLFSIDVTLTFVSLVLFPLMFLGVNLLSRRVYARSREAQEQLAVISARAQENFSGIRQVKTYVQEEREIEAFAAACDEYRARNLSMALLHGAMIALIGIVTGVGTLIVIAIGGRHVIQGTLSFAEFVEFNAYLALLAWPTIAFGWIVNVFQRGIGAMERIALVLDAEPAIPSPLDEAPAGDAARATGSLSIRGLTYTYPGASGPSLVDVDLELPAGTSLGIVGSVGSGKSTLADLIARVYAAPPGTIFLDGDDITSLPTRRVRDAIAYVPQEALLFTRSLRENVAIGARDGDDGAVERAVRDARLAGDLDALPEGLDTVVGERGFTLSGGQRQRATLARALAADRPVLLLDDALSAVDADTERAILDGLSRQRRDRTCVLISHRLSALAGLDRIVVLERGRVVESGTHEELAAAGGVYARLLETARLQQRLESS